MDLASVVGLIGAFLAVIGTMVLGGQVAIFINLPSIGIVVIGSIFVVSMKFSVQQLAGAFKVASFAFINKLEPPEKLIELMVDLGWTAFKKGGVLALEGVEIKDPFVKSGVQLIVDGMDPEDVKARLRTEQRLSIVRHEEGQRIFKSAGDVAPAMGMIGTLIGLVQMLVNMDDPKTIGPAMAIALLTTLYGSIIANMIALPIADKLEMRGANEETNQSIAIDAILAIQKGTNPRLMKESLQSYLPRAKRDYSDDDGGAGEGAQAA